MKKKVKWEDDYFITKPRRLPLGKFYVRFYSRHEWPWYQAGFVSSSWEEMWAHFGMFKLKAEAHRRNL